MSLDRYNWQSFSDNSCTGQSNDTVIIAVVVPGVVVTVVILLLISVMAMLIYKYLNGTKTCCELYRISCGRML